MAILRQMPSQAIVDAFRGVVDFYEWCGLVVARKWPRAPERARNDNVIASGQRFAYINRLASTLDPDIRQLYVDMATQGGLTWKDYLTRLYLNGQRWWTQS